MFRTSKSNLAHATVFAGTVSLLLSSSAFAGFHVGGGFRTGSFIRAPAMARVTAAIHPSFDRGSVLRATNSAAPDRFVGVRAVYRAPFPSNGIAGMASHPQQTLPPGVALLKGTPSGWHAPSFGSSIGSSVGGNPAPSPGIAAYGVTIATAPAGKTVGQNGAATLGTVQTSAATSGNAPAGALGGLFAPYSGPGAIGSLQLGAGTSGNAQTGALGGLFYNGPGAIGSVQLGAATSGNVNRPVVTGSVWNGRSRIGGGAGGNVPISVGEVSVGGGAIGGNVSAQGNSERSKLLSTISNMMNSLGAQQQSIAQNIGH